MNRSFQFLLPALLFLAACNQSAREAGNMKAGETTSLDTTVVTTADAPMALNAADRKFIKTADLRCRVTDVYDATAKAEHAVAGIGGLVIESHYENEVQRRESLPYSADSLRQVQTYTTTAHITLRVPVALLDTVMSTVAANAAFVDSRNLNLEDVTMRYLGAKLKEDAGDNGDATQHAAALARKTTDAIDAADFAATRKEQSIDRRIARLDLQDQTAYATLKIALYQPERMDQLIVFNTDRSLEPSFGQRTTAALAGSWEGVKTCSILVIASWPLLLAGGITLLVIKAYRRKRTAGAHLVPRSR